VGPCDGTILLPKSKTFTADLKSVGTIMRMMMIPMLRLFLIIMDDDEESWSRRRRGRKRSRITVHENQENFQYFMFLTHLSFHLVICEYFVYSPGFDENATKCQSETSREKPSINLKIITSEYTVRELLRVDIQRIWEIELKGY